MKVDCYEKMAKLRGMHRLICGTKTYDSLSPNEGHLLLSEHACMQIEYSKSNNLPGVD